MNGRAHRGTHHWTHHWAALKARLRDAEDTGNDARRRRPLPEGSSMSDFYAKPEPVPTASQQPAPQQPGAYGGYQGAPAGGYPAPAGFLGPGTAQPAPGSGLAVTSLVLGILAVLGCWIPLVNVVTILMGVAALVTGLVAIARVRKGTGGGRGLGVAGVMLGIVAVVVSVVVLVVTVATVSAVDEGLQEVADEAGSRAGDEGVAADDGQVEQAAAALALGSVASIDEYDIAVTAVNLDADAALASVNSFNEPPTGRYVLVTTSVVYTGTEEGEPWLDLSTSLQGSDARQYDSSSCGAVVGSSVMDVPTLTTGGAATYELCMDVPVAALTGATVFVESSFSLGDGDRTYWDLP